MPPDAALRARLARYSGDLERAWGLARCPIGGTGGGSFSEFQLRADAESETRRGAENLQN